MNLAKYKQLVEAIPYGKRLPNALYVYRDASIDFGTELTSLVNKLQAAYTLGEEFNILKFRSDELKLSFLSYPDFLETSHPALRCAVTIDLAANKIRRTDYSGHSNTPILHRKELFLPAGHDRCAEFAALSSAEEAAGLYAETHTIGFKLNWERLLKEKGLEIIGHELRTFAPSGSDDHEHHTTKAVERHKTAMARYDLSKPVKILLEYGLLEYCEQRRFVQTIFQYLYPSIPSVG